MKGEPKRLSFRFLKKLMDVLFEQQWRALLNALEQRFGGGMDLQDILYLVGVQELGKGFQKLRNRRKWTSCTWLCARF